MGDVVRSTSEPQLGAIRLAWWRERLEEMDEGVRAPAEPRLRAVQHELLPRGIAGSALGGLTLAWQRLLEPFPWDSGLVQAIADRGCSLFDQGVLIIRGPGDRVELGGGIWAIVDAARHCSDAETRELLLREARSLAAPPSYAVPPKLRSLSMLAALAIRDCKRGFPFEPEGTPARAVLMLRHRLSGRFPQ